MKYGKRIKLNLVLKFFLLLFIGFFFFSGYFIFSIKYSPTLIKNDIQLPLTFWKYQCVDTMKTSRDKAREWMNRTDLDSEIDFEVKEVANLGANCIAIDTPYDNEFLPYLNHWVQKARKYNLKVLFRGNFSSWEGWFGYKKGMTPDELFKKIDSFIKNNSTLFVNDDIFVSAPEAEDGGPFNQVEKAQYDSFRAFLINEYNHTSDSFKSINKNLVLNWLSMNGGLAKRIMNSKTASQLNDIIAIDHYIKTPQEMGEYVDYFKNTFNANVVIGEWGAPIPDINGSMTESEQASFNGDLLKQMYDKRNSINGINYWDLYDGSTALLNSDKSERSTYKVLQSFYKPTLIRGSVFNILNEPVANANVSSNFGNSTKTDNNGNFAILLPSLNDTLTIKSSGNKDYSKTIHAGSSESTIILNKQSENLDETIKESLIGIKNKFLN